MYRQPESNSFAELKREFHSRGISLMSIGVFMKKYDVVLRELSRKKRGIRVTRVGMFRVLDYKCFTPTYMNVSAAKVEEFEYTPEYMANKAIDQNCVVLPALSPFIGAFRFIPIDDVPTLTGTNYKYFKCKDIATATSISMWLRSPKVIDAINWELGVNNTDIGDIDFIKSIPIPEEILNPTVIIKAMTLELKIVEHHREVDELLAELIELQGEI